MTPLSWGDTRPTGARGSFVAVIEHLHQAETGLLEATTEARELPAGDRAEVIAALEAEHRTIQELRKGIREMQAFYLAHLEVGP